MKCLLISPLLITITGLAAFSSTKEMLYLECSNPLPHIAGGTHITRFDINLKENTAIFSSRIDNSLKIDKFSRDQVTITNREIILVMSSGLRVEIDRMTGIRKVYDSQLKKYSGRATCIEVSPSKRKF